MIFYLVILDNAIYTLYASYLSSYLLLIRAYYAIE